MSSSYDSAVVDTAMIEDPRLLILPRGVRLVHLEALVWCKARHTDGFVPTGGLGRLTDEADPHRAAEMLVKATLWTEVEGGWQMVGFTDTQMSAERVQRLREASRERYDRWHETHKPQRVSNGAANGASNGPARPPAPPALKGGGQRVEVVDGAAALGAGLVALPRKDDQPKPSVCWGCAEPLKPSDAVEHGAMGWIHRHHLEPDSQIETVGSRYEKAVGE